LETRKYQKHFCNLTLLFFRVKAPGYIGANLKTVTSGLSKAPKVIGQVKEGIKDLKELLPKIKGLIDTADEVGKKAAEKKLLTIDEIFDQFQTAPKKTPQELAALKKEKERKNKKKSKKNKKDSKKPEQQKP
jgi:hypothetical protein